MSNPLRRLGELGQSVWYDNLGRELLQNGELKRLIQDDGVTGVTSNPTIFEKSIRTEKTYDSDLHGLVDLGKDVKTIYEELAVADIRETADLMLPVYERTEGVDGYVSLEVSPELAYNTRGTVEEAKRLFEFVGRKNLMIKVPATREGLVAVEELIATGINVNVTLVFSLDQYQGAAKAYMKGLKQWASSGGDPARVASVASFFVSRVDTAVDERLKDVNNPEHRSTASELLGKAAIANARLAYLAYKETFRGEPFADLKARGARPQRVVWASTSTKNPNYPDTYYVEALIGPETIDTIPTTTLAAYRDHGQPAVRLDEDLDEARALYPKLREIGVNVDEVMERLLADGVKAFADSFADLLEGIKTKRSRLLRGWGHRSASLGKFQQKVEESLQRCEREKIAERLWAGDYSIWKDDPGHGAEISQRLGWLQVPETMMGETERLKDFADEIRSAGFTTAVLLGMGGSSLTSEVFRTCYGVAKGYLDLKVLDTTVPASILAVERQLDMEHTLFIVSSKSGGTIEVFSLYKYFRARVDEIKGEKAGEHFVAITDPGTSLGKMASEHRFRKVFLNPPDIGGRFSGLSYFGLVPAALIGADIDRILMRASQAIESSIPEVPALENPGLWLGVIMGEGALAGKDKMSCILSPRIACFGKWMEQMIAESTGKEGKGIIPIADEPLGDPKDYGNDRLFMYLRIDQEDTHDSAISALEKAGHLVVTLRLHSPYDLGREIFRWGFATAVAGSILKINPFDQPNVQEAKDLTEAFLERFSKEGKLPSGEECNISDPALTSKLSDLFGLLRDGDYVAFNAFISSSPQNSELLQTARKAIRDRFKVATSVGFGPRYLHSTGQIHKGGPGTGLYIQITSDDPEDIGVPGESYSFGVLKSSQSLGDYGALKRRGRRILGVHLGSDAEVEKLVELIQNL